ncbi:MAG: TIGR01548 family HAD-type hydrolase [Cyanobacteria bacterium J06614_10]
MSPFAIAVFDIDGVLRDVGGSYRRAIADTVAHYTGGQFRPTLEDIDRLKSEGIWNNDWKASEVMIHRYFERQSQPEPTVSYEEIVDFFQKQYRGPDTEDPDQWTGYIANEPLLVDKAYFQSLADAGMPHAFFSGATRGSASFVLERRIGLSDPILIAMEDGPGKPDPSGLAKSVQLVEADLAGSDNLPVVYAGDTAADMKTIVAAKEQFSQRTWLAVGILPPHAQREEAYKKDYIQMLKAAGAETVLSNVREMTPALVKTLL